LGETCNSFYSDKYSTLFSTSKKKRIVKLFNLVALLDCLVQVPVARFLLPQVVEIVQMTLTRVFWAPFAHLG
jgi:hypothetical protein